MANDDQLVRNLNAIVWEKSGFITPVIGSTAPTEMSAEAVKMITGTRSNVRKNDAGFLTVSGKEALTKLADAGVIFPGFEKFKTATVAANRVVGGLA